MRSVFTKSLLGVGASRLRAGTGPFPVHVIFVFGGEVAGISAFALDAGKRTIGVYDHPFSFESGVGLTVLHGGRDQRIPRSFVEGTAGLLKRLGFDVRLKVYDEEDHYMLFSQPEVVLGDIMEWMTAHSGRRP